MRLFLLFAVVAVGLLPLSMDTADAHLGVPTYDGNEWGTSCLASAGGRSTAETCCNHSRSFCQAACDLTANVPATWKTSCRANCQSASAVCLSKVKGLPPVHRPLDKKPPATPN